MFIFKLANSHRCALPYHIIDKPHLIFQETLTHASSPRDSPSRATASYISTSSFEPQARSHEMKTEIMTRSAFEASSGNAEPRMHYTKWHDTEIKPEKS
jgi:hypothetical protein